MSAVHAPIEHTYPDGRAVDCVCGERGGLFCHDVGARTAFLEHVVTAIATDHGWAETYSVDVDTTYVGDAG